MDFANKRISKDLESLLPNLPFWIKLINQEDLQLTFEICPTEGPFKDEKCVVIYNFPVQFPFQSPKIQLLEPLSVRNNHPFIDPQYGSVCMDVLRLGWMPTIGLDTIVYGMALMLDDPLTLLDESSNDFAVLNEKALLTMKKNKKE